MSRTLDDYGRDLENIQTTLVAALGVRHQVTGLLDLAHKITLVSLNAKVSSAQVGEAGKVFAVMTSEITAVSDSLRAAVREIRALTREWTLRIAGTSQALRQLRQLAAARARRGPDVAFPPVAAALAAAELRAAEEQAAFPRLAQDLLQVLDELQGTMRIVNYVKVGILVESERLSGAMGGQVSPFHHLAVEIQSAADLIRQITAHTMMRLRQLGAARLAAAGPA